MSFKLIRSRQWQDRPDAWIILNTGGATFNPAAVDMVGFDLTRCVVFYDKEKSLLAFTFFKGKLTGSYAFTEHPKSRRRVIRLRAFLKANNILKTMKGPGFPLEVCKETIPDYEGSVIFMINLNRSE